MTNDVSLSGAMRSNLLLLQNTQTLIDRTQNRLATGQKINTALDGPQQFFASKGLSQRAGDMLFLKDAMGQAINTIKAADAAVTAIEELIEQARGIAQSARDVQGQDENAVAERADLAVQFNQIILQTNDIARDAGYGGRNLAIGNGLLLGADQATLNQVNSIVGIGNGQITNVAEVDNYNISVTGTGRISANGGDVAEASSLRGLRQIAVTGFHSAAFGNFDDIEIEVFGGEGEDKIITVTEGSRSVTQTFDRDDLVNQPGRFSHTFESGTSVRFDLDLDAMESVPKTAGEGRSVIEKQVDLQVVVQEGFNTTTQVGQREIVRDGTRTAGTGKLANGENAFMFNDATVRLNIDEETLMASSTFSTSAAGDAYGLAGAAIIGQPVISGGAIAAGAEQTYTMSTVQIAGVDDLAATRSATNPNVVGVAEQFQRFDVTVSALTTGQTASFQVNGQTISFTASTGLASAVVASALISAFNAISVVTAAATAVRTGNTIIVTADSSSANITVSNPAGAAPPSIAQTQANVQPVTVQAQVDTFTFSGTAEQNEVINININGTDYQYRIAAGDTLQNALSQLAVLANADSAVTVAATASALVVTAVTAGVAFSAAAGTQNFDPVFDITLSNGTSTVTNRVTGDGIQPVTFSAPNAQIDEIRLLNNTDVLTSGQTASVTIGGTAVVVTAPTAGYSANATISALVIAINASAVGTAVTATVGANGLSILLTSNTAGTANPALSALTAGDMDFESETISPNVVTPFGDGVTGVTLNLSMEELVLAAAGDATNGPWDANFNLRGAQTGRSEVLSSTELIPGSTANNLRVQFNERNTSDILVESVNIQTNGQGLRLDSAANNWRDLADIDEAFDDLDFARSRLRSAAASFGTNLNIITTREVFTVEFTNVLTEGADKLVLADQNEEGATLLTLQTRQQLGTISLSIANESQQAILRLF
ncbi:MAG: hypothetical protein AAGF58_03855 [Pseudomonadota bacterium]